MDANLLKTGKFGQTLVRNNKQLREDRGLKIASTAEKMYRRKIEDLEDKLADLLIERDNLLDLNPGNTQTIINPTEFDADAFVNTDIDISLKIRNTRIRLSEAKAQYSRLFTDDPAPEGTEVEVLPENQS